MIVGTTQNNIPFYVKYGFDKYYKTEYNFFLDNYNKEVWDGNLHCIDMVLLLLYEYIIIICKTYKMKIVKNLQKARNSLINY